MRSRMWSGTAKPRTRNTVNRLRAASSVRPSLRPSVRPSLRPSLRPSVRPSVRHWVSPWDRPSVSPCETYFFAKSLWYS
jgi:hypothetical protein